MALKVAELVATLELDASKMASGMTREVEQSKQKLAKGLRDASESAGKELSKGLTDAAEDATDGVERVLKDSGRDLERVSERVGTDMGDALADGLETAAKDLTAVVDPSDLGSRSEFGDHGDMLGGALADGIESAARGVSSKVDPSDVSGGRSEWRSEGEQLGDSLVDGIEDGVDDGGGSLNTAVDGLLGGLPLAMTGPAAAAGAAVAALLVTGMSRALADEETAKKIGAVLDLEGPQRSEAVGVADNLRNDGFDPALAEEAVIHVRSSFDDSELRDGLEDGVRQAIAFSTQFEASMLETVTAASQLVENGMAKDLTDAFDLLGTLMAGAKAGSREELLAATEEYTTFASGVGLSGERMFGILDTAADGNRYTVDKLGDSLLTLGEQNRNMTDEMRGMYEMLGLDAEDMQARFAAADPTALSDLADAMLAIEDPLARANAGMVLFGTPWEYIAADVEQMDAVLQALVDGSMTDYSGKSAEVVESTDTMQAKVDETWATITGVVGDSVGGILLMIGSLWDEEIRAQFGQAWDMTAGGMLTSINEGIDGVVSSVAGLPGRIGEAASGMWDGLVDGFKQALGRIVGGWNGMTFPAFDIPSVTVPGLGKIGGGKIGGWDLPDMPLPKFHDGGLVEGMAGQEVLAKLLPGERVLNVEQTQAFDSGEMWLSALAATPERAPATTPLIDRAPANRIPFTVTAFA